MIGNDIVDLTLTQKESNWKRKGFLDKIFSYQEQSLIHSSGNKNRMVWNLWSRKEAAYKIYNRQTGIRGFFPLQLICNFIDSKNGTVCINNFIYYTYTEITKEFIHTIAVLNKDDFNKIRILEIHSKIEKINGIPFIFNPKTGITKPVSISHHGKFQRNITFL